MQDALSKLHTKIKQKLSFARSVPSYVLHAFWRVMKGNKIKRKRIYLGKVALCDGTSTGVDTQLHFRDFLVDFLHKVDDEVHQLVLVHLLGMCVGDQERDIIALRKTSEKSHGVNICIRTKRRGALWKSNVTSTGFRRRITKLSARIIKKRANLWHRIRSRSSACLTLMLTRIELTDVSTSTFSFSLRLITSGFMSTSLDLLRNKKNAYMYPSKRERKRAFRRRAFVFYPDSTSGVLCRSAISDEKLSRQRAAVNVDRTAVR